MSLADLIAKHTVTKGPRCAVGIARERLTEADSAELGNYLAGDTASTAIAKGLSELTGMHVGPESVARHRRGDCLCPR